MLNFKEINLNDYEEFGAGATAASYNSKIDENVMLKLYFQHIDESIPLREKELSDTVISLGIPSAPAIDLVKYGARTGVTFRRLKDKRSISRLIADDSENIEKYVNAFAVSCKSLHCTDADCKVLPSGSEHFKKITLASDFLNDDEKNRLIRLIDSAGPASTCLHGDMGPTNLVIAQDKEYWIDVADFSYGYPFFDLGTLYAILFCLDPDRLLKNQHLTEAQAASFWDYFAKAYLSYDPASESFTTPPSDEAIALFTKKAALFSVFGVLFFSTHLEDAPTVQRMFDRVLPFI